MALVDYKHEIVNASQDILDAVVEVYEEAGESLPALRYYTIGSPNSTVHDTDKLVVLFNQAYVGKIGSQGFEAVSCGSDRWTYVFSIELVRGSYPTITSGGKSTKASIPDAKDYRDDAIIRMKDAYLMRKVGQRISTNTGSDYLSDVQVTQPSGGFASVILNVFLESIHLKDDYSGGF